MILLMILMLSILDDCRKILATSNVLESLVDILMDSQPMPLTQSLIISIITDLIETSKTIIIIIIIRWCHSYVHLEDEILSVMLNLEYYGRHPKYQSKVLMMLSAFSFKGNSIYDIIMIPSSHSIRISSEVSSSTWIHRHVESNERKKRRVSSACIDAYWTFGGSRWFGIWHQHNLESHRGDDAVRIECFS